MSRRDSPRSSSSDVSSSQPNKLFTPFLAETIAATAEKFVEDGTMDRIIERADSMKQNLRDAGFEIYEYDPEKPYVYKAPEHLKQYNFDSESGLFNRKLYNGLLVLTISLDSSLFFTNK